MDINFVEQFNLAYVHIAAALTGVGLALYAMQLWSLKIINGSDNFVIGQMRRASLILLAMALLWSIHYSLEKRWQPWPSDLVTVLAVDLFLFATVLGAHLRRNGSPAVR